METMFLRPSASFLSSAVGFEVQSLSAQITRKIRHLLHLDKSKHALTATDHFQHSHYRILNSGPRTPRDLCGRECPKRFSSLGHSIGVIRRAASCSTKDSRRRWQPPPRSVPDPQPRVPAISVSDATTPMKLTVVPLTPDRWPDPERVFHSKGCWVARSCGCLAYRLSGSRDSSRPKGMTRAQANRALKGLD